MFDRISSSFELARSSWDVLRQHKKLVLFPIISGIGCMLVLISFAAPFIALAINGGIHVHQHEQPPWWTYVVAFAFYFCNYFVIVFCNAALISCTLLCFAGEEPTLSDGFSAATARLPQILAWTLVSATVGVILKAIENAHERAGEIISAIFGTAWTVLTFFVVPVLVVEKVGPFEAIQRSMQLLRKTWGEALIGHWGLGIFTFLLSLPSFVFFMIGAGLISSGSHAAGLGVIGLGIVYLLACSAISSALNTIFLGAMYQYAAYKTVPVGFDREVMERAFRSKR